MPIFRKWVDVGETGKPLSNFAQKSDLATATEDVFSENSIANNSSQGIISSVSQNTDQLCLTRTSFEDSCASLQISFANFSTDDAYCKTSKNFESKAAKANAVGFPEEGEGEKLTTEAK